MNAKFFFLTKKIIEKNFSKNISDASYNKTDDRLRARQKNFLRLRFARMKNRRFLSHSEKLLFLWKKSFY